MNRVEEFKTYEEFRKRREELEGENKNFVDSYCDRKLGVFRLTWHTIYKE